MKSLILVLLAVSATAFARGHNERRHAVPECAELKSACQKAGYERGAHDSGKGLFRDCMDKLVGGQKVPGLNLEPSNPAAAKCKAALALNERESKVDHEKSTKSPEGHGKLGKTKPTSKTK